MKIVLDQSMEELVIEVLAEDKNGKISPQNVQIVFYKSCIQIIHNESVIGEINIE